MGRGLGARQRELLDWIGAQVLALSRGEPYSNGAGRQFFAPAGPVDLQELGVPRYRLANTYAGPDATAAQLESARRSIRTLQDRGLIAERKIKLVPMSTGELMKEDAAELLTKKRLQARNLVLVEWAYCLQPEGAEPVERWKINPDAPTYGGIFRDALLAHVTTEPQEWLELEPKILKTVEQLAVERGGEGWRPLGTHRYRLVEMRGYLERKGRLLVGERRRQYSDNGAVINDWRHSCTVQLPSP